MVSGDGIRTSRKFSGESFASGPHRDDVPLGKKDFGLVKQSHIDQARLLECLLSLTSASTLIAQPAVGPLPLALSLVGLDLVSMCKTKTRIPFISLVDTSPSSIMRSLISSLVILSCPKFVSFAHSYCSMGLAGLRLCMETKHMFRPFLCLRSTLSSSSHVLTFSASNPAVRAAPLL